MTIIGLNKREITGFTYDLRHSSEYGVYLLRSNFRLMPETRDRYETITGRHGELDFGFDFAGRIIQLECFIEATSNVQLRQRVRDIAAWLDPSKGERQLILDADPDKYYMARVAGTADVEVIALSGRVAIPFRASDPFAYAVVDDVFTYSGPGSYRLYRRGTAVSYPKIEIKGTSGGGNAKITITLNGKTLNYTGTLSVGETLVLDSDTITAYKNTTNGRVSVINDIDSIDFPISVPETNNLTVSVSVGATVSKITITCRSRWI